MRQAKTLCYINLLFSAIAFLLLGVFSNLNYSILLLILEAYIRYNFDKRMLLNHYVKIDYINPILITNMVIAIFNALVIILFAYVKDTIIIPFTAMAINAHITKQFFKLESKV